MILSVQMTHPLRLAASCNHTTTNTLPRWGESLATVIIIRAYNSTIMGPRSIQSITMQPHCMGRLPFGIGLGDSPKRRI